MRSQSRRRWLLSGLGLGLIVAGLRYYRRRFRSIPTSDFITERHATAFLVRCRIDSDRVEEIRDSVAKEIVGVDSDSLLGLEDASTGSLFVDQESDEPELVWYVEIPRSVTAGWVDPEATVADAFPLDHDAIDIAADGVDTELLVHAVNPARPRSVVPTEAGPLAVADVTDEWTVDVELIRVRLKPGFPERLTDRFAELSRRFEVADLSLGPIEEWSAEMIDIEDM